MPAATPMLEQYHRAKRAHPDAIVMFRLGDFYEMFYEDAEVASRLLDIALTARGRGTGNEAPMCGVPYHAADGYVARLVGAGHRVALCDQVEDASRAKGLVRREVVRVVSPGLMTDPGSLDARTPLFLASICRTSDRVGCAYADLSSGDLRVAEAPLARAAESLAIQFVAFRPREILLPEGEDADGLLPPSAAEPPIPVTRAPAWMFGEDSALRTLTTTLRTGTLAGFGWTDSGAAVRAAGALLMHLGETQKSRLDHFTRLRPFLPSEHLILDETTVRTLEIVAGMRDGKREGTLLAVLDRTVTPMGARLLRSWLVAPSTDVALIDARQGAVAELAASPSKREDLRSALRGVRDVERILGRLAIGTAGARDLVALRDSLGALPVLAGVRDGLSAPALRRAPSDEDLLEDVEALIRGAIADEPAPTLHDGGLVRDGHDAALDELRAISRNGRAYIAEIETRER
ncbi:MAG TPA: DNA mismatch repair protein MutS, partial [Verrucomicrobiae bacterium]|nr:DNA mismatch repair protein MutS [Verrucomicrobiae bacterium]